MQRCIYVAPVKEDGSTASSTNVYLIGSAVDLVNPSKIQPGEDVFLDFTHKGYLVDFRQFRLTESK